MPCDAVIAAVGEKPDPAAFLRYGVALDEKGRAPAQSGNVFVAGDALRGPATVVEAIADAAAFAEAVIGAQPAVVPADAGVGEAAARERKGVLRLPGEGEGRRCLSCAEVCETCVSVCPNRANLALRVPGMEKPQILHLDYLCNECGNCASFCPYDSVPYKEKFTYFKDEKDMADSENNGFCLLSPEGGRVRLRLEGRVSEHSIEEEGLDLRVKALILAVLKDYAYII